MGGGLLGAKELSVYWSGNDWMDMCRGPHLASTGRLDPQAFKLTRVSGAYWRGDQNNPQLSRIWHMTGSTRNNSMRILSRLEKQRSATIARSGEMDITPRSEAHEAVFWHPNGYMVWRPA